MAILGMLLLGIGYLIAFAGGIWIVVLAFQKSVIWGLGSLVVPLVALIFVIQNWETAKKPFLIQLGGVALLVLGTVIAGLGGGGTAAG